MLREPAKTHTQTKKQNKSIRTCNSLSRTAESQNLLETALQLRFHYINTTNLTTLFKGDI